MTLPSDKALYFMAAADKMMREMLRTTSWESRHQLALDFVWPNRHSHVGCPRCGCQLSVDTGGSTLEKSEVRALMRSIVLFYRRVLAVQISLFESWSGKNFHL